MATAKKLPSGSWRCQVYSHTEKTIQPDGTTKEKRIYKSFTCDVPGAKGKRLCEQMAADWAVDKEKESKVENITLYEAYTRYIKNKSKTLSPSTIREYKRQHIRNLPTLMTMNISDITAEDIQSAINKEAEERSPKTVRNIHGLLSAVLNTYRPELSLNTTLPKKVRPSLYIPTDAEIKKLMDYIKDDPMEIPILLAAFGPMRRGEICALSASDIKNGIVHVYKNMVLNDEKEWIIKAPKSYSGDRYIRFPDFVLAKLPKYGKITELNPSMITDRFQDVLKRAGIHHFRFHDLRHYCASVQHAIGVPDAYIMQRGGWGSDRVLKEVYRHVMADKTKDMDDKANVYFQNMQHKKIRGCRTK